MKYIVFFLVATVMAVGCGVKQPEAEPTEKESATVSERLARFVPVELKWDPSVLTESEMKVLAKLVEAAKVIDVLFLKQVHEKNMEWLEQIHDSDTRLYFQVNFGPWDRLNEDEPFWGDLPKPPGAGFYPEDLTKEEFLEFLDANPEKKEAMRGWFTVIQRKDDGLEAIPYSEYYRADLQKAANLLKEAAKLTDNRSLKKFLVSRADAFLSNRYTESDKAWMDIRDSVIDPTIGPYEVYEDKLFAYKAAFEAFISVVDREESEKLAGVARYLEEMEKNLPLPKNLSSQPRGGESPIRVVNLVFNAGDGKAGVQTLAFNLPNDETVRKEKGSKKVLMKNMMEAKFEGILMPIAEKMLAKQNLDHVSSEAFFNFILFHEISHGMGPGILGVVDGEPITVSTRLKDLYPAIEEAKADVMGVYNILYLIKKGFLPAELAMELPSTYLAGMFRSIRFGAEEAHGKGIALQLNYFMEKGALTRQGDGLYSVNMEAFAPALSSLLEEILVLQAMGDYEGTRELLDKYGVVSDRLHDDLKRLTTIPVDIRPVFILP